MKFAIEKEIDALDDWMLAQPHRFQERFGEREYRDLTPHEEAVARRRDTLQELTALQKPVLFHWTFRMWRNACPCAAI